MKRLTEEQMRDWMLSQMKVCSCKKEYSFFTDDELEFVADKILDELDSSEEQPAEEVDPTSVEARADMFFSEITARLATGRGDDAVPTIQDRYRYIARRSLELENAAVAELKAERNKLKAEADSVWKALCEEPDDSLHSHVIAINGLIHRRDELKAKLADRDRALRAQDRIIEAAERERDDLIAQVDRLMDADVNQYNILIAENSDLKRKVEQFTKERDDLTEKLSVKESAIEYRRNEVACLEKEYDELKTEKSDLENQLKNAKNELAGWKADFSDFTALRERRLTFAEKERIVEKASMELARERDELKAKLDYIEKLASGR